VRGLIFGSQFVVCIVLARRVAGLLDGWQQSGSRLWQILRNFSLNCHFHFARLAPRYLLHGF